MVCNPKTQREDSFILAVKQAFKGVLLDQGIKLPRTARLLHAFSGGPDSTALLAALANFSQEFGVELHVCHINHGLRGKESDDDEEFCRTLCKLWDIPLYVERLSGEEHSEADLRQLRYGCLEKVASNIDSHIILTGHTLDDQIETMLFRLFRGTGPAGLMGIPAARKISDRLIVLRPLLAISKADCLRFLARIGVSPRHDSSNQNDAYSRNFIRNQILPLIEERFPGFRDRAEQLRQVISSDESLLECLSQDAVAELGEHSGDQDLWFLDEFNELPLSLRRRVLCRALRDRDIECDFARIESLLKIIDADGDAGVSLNETWEVRLSRGELHWRSRLIDKCAQAEDFSQVSVPVRSEGLTLILKLGLAINVERVQEQSEYLRLPGSQEFEVIGDLSKTGPLIIRFREEGDQIQPLGMSCMVRLKKFLHTHKSSRTLSFGGRVLVLANDTEVLWVPGCGMSQRIAIGNRATHRIQLVKLNPDETSFC